MPPKNGFELKSHWAFTVTSREAVIILVRYLSSSVPLPGLIELKSTLVRAGCNVAVYALDNKQVL